MEVSIVGRTMAPVPHNYLSQIELERSQTTVNRTLSISRQLSAAKLPVKFLLDARKEHWLHGPIYDRSKLSISPVLRKMTLAETYNFARAQLNSQPLLELRQRKSRTPTLSFSKYQINNIVVKREAEPKDPEFTKSTTPLISCKAEKVKNPALQNEITENQKSENVERDIILNQTTKIKSLKSQSGSRKRKKSSHKRKSHRQATPQKYGPPKRSGNIPPAPKLNLSRLPAELSARNKLLPPTTQQSSIFTLQNTLIHNKSAKTDEFILPSSTMSMRESSSNASTKLRSSNQLQTRNVEWKPIRNENLLTSLDSALNRKAQLSMRIQLIHKYGNEDVISKHREVSRKREAADKHEKKNLELQASAKSKEQQRAKIYALNQLMTRLEQDQFEKYNKQKSV